MHEEESKNTKRERESRHLLRGITSCVALAVSEHKEACRLKIGKHFVTFDDVDVNILIETGVAGKAYPVNYIAKE